MNPLLVLISASNFLPQGFLLQDFRSKKEVIVIQFEESLIITISNITIILKGSDYSNIHFLINKIANMLVLILGLYLTKFKKIHKMAKVSFIRKSLLSM